LFNTSNTKTQENYKENSTKTQEYTINTPIEKHGQIKKVQNYIQLQNTQTYKKTTKHKNTIHTRIIAEFTKIKQCNKLVTELTKNTKYKIQKYTIYKNTKAKKQKIQHNYTKTIQ